MNKKEFEEWLDIEFELLKEKIKANKPEEKKTKKDQAPAQSFIAQSQVK